MFLGSDDVEYSEALRKAKKILNFEQRILISSYLNVDLRTEGPSSRFLLNLLRIKRSYLFFSIWTKFFEKFSSLRLIIFYYGLNWCYLTIFKIWNFNTGDKVSIGISGFYHIFRNLRNFRSQDFHHQVGRFFRNKLIH